MVISLKVNGGLSSRNYKLERGAGKGLTPKVCVSAVGKHNSG